MIRSPGLCGAVAALALWYPHAADTAGDVVVPHLTGETEAR